MTLSRLLAILAAILVSNCARAPERLVTYQRLLDVSEMDEQRPGSLRNAVVRSNSPFEVHDAEIHGDRRPSLVLESPSKLFFRSDVPRGGELRFGLAVRKPEVPVEIRLTVVDGEVVNQEIWQEVWQEERDWVERRIDLSRFAGRSLELELSVDGPQAMVILGNPEVVGVASRAEAKRPNVLVYVVDCLRADHVGAYGYPLPATPTLDALAEDGVVLEELMSCAPWTKPSTGFLFTSLLPMYHQARTIDDALPYERLTLAEAFRASGYTTAAWVANPVIKPRVFFFNQGFDRWVDLRTFKARSAGQHINALESDAADITNGVLPWLEENRGRSFFLYLHSLDLHFGYRPRPPFDEIFVKTAEEGLTRDRELYDNELAYNDREIGRLVEALKALELYDETLLLVTADHGEEFGEHDFTRHGKTLFREALHIPGILKLPHSEKAGRRIPSLVGNIDLAPSLLELAGLPVPSVFQGRSIAPLLEGGETSERRLLAELVAPKFVSYAVYDEDHKYIRELVPTPKEYLFDVKKDRAERKNLLPSVPPQARELVAELERFVQLGQHGLHFSIRGDKAGTRVVVHAESEVEIINAFRFPIVTGDLFDVDSKRKKLTLTFTADDRRRHLVIQTRTGGSPVRFALVRDGHTVETVRARLGSERVETIAFPFDANPKELQVSLSEIDDLLHREDELARVWHLPLGSARNQVELDREMQDTLRALGYIQ